MPFPRFVADVKPNILPEKSSGVPPDLTSINGFVACVVGYNNLDVFAGCFIQCDSSAAGFTSFFLNRNDACEKLVADSLVNHESCNILVIREQ